MNRTYIFIVICIIQGEKKDCCQPLDHFAVMKGRTSKAVKRRGASDCILCLGKYYSKATIINIQIRNAKM